MWYLKEDLNNNEAVAKFEFKDIDSKYYQWNSTTQILEVVKRDFRKEIDNYRHLDIKSIYEKTGEIPEVTSSNYFDSTVFADSSFHDIYGYMNGLKNTLYNIDLMNYNYQNSINNTNNTNSIHVSKNDKEQQSKQETKE